MSYKTLRIQYQESMGLISYPTFTRRIQNRGLDKAISTPPLGLGGYCHRRIGNRTIKELWKISIEDGLNMNYKQFVYRIRKYNIDPNNI